MDFSISMNKKEQHNRLLTAGGGLLSGAHNDMVNDHDRYKAGHHDRVQEIFPGEKNGQCFTYLILLIFLVSIQGCVTNPSNINSKVDEGTFIEKSSSLPFLGLPAPTSVEDALQNGDQAYKALDFNRALFEYVRALDLDDKNPAIYVKIGNAHVKMKNNGVAHLAFNESLKLDPNHIATLESMGNLFLRNNKIPEAKGYLEKAVNLYEEGTQKADAALVFPISAYTSMGIAMDMENDTQKAIGYYYKALDKAPYSYSIHNNIGYSYYLSGAWAEAERFYARAIELNNKYALAWKNLGLLYARQDRFMESMNAFEQVMEKSKAYNDIGYICLIDGKYEEAEVFLIKAIDLNTRYYKIAEQNLEKVRWHKQLAEVEKVDSKSSRPKRVVYKPKKVEKPVAKKIEKPIAKKAPSNEKSPEPVIESPQQVTESEVIKSTQTQPLYLKGNEAEQISSVNTPSSYNALDADLRVTNRSAAVSLPEGAEVSDSALRKHWSNKRNNADNEPETAANSEE